MPPRSTRRPCASTSGRSTPNSCSRICVSGARPRSGAGQTEGSVLGRRREWSATTKWRPRPALAQQSAHARTAARDSALPNGTTVTFSCTDPAPFRPHARSAPSDKADGHAARLQVQLAAVTGCTAHLPIRARPGGIRRRLAWPTRMDSVTRITPMDAPGQTPGKRLHSPVAASTRVRTATRPASRRPPDGDAHPVPPATIRRAACAIIKPIGDRSGLDCRHIFQRPGALPWPANC